MYNNFIKFISDNNLIKPGDRLLLAVSGGIDSMVMTNLFLRLGPEFGIAHCNFSLRGGESDGDEEMVCKLSADHNIPFFSKRFETKTYAKKNGLSIQMAARELRYSWFEKIRIENNYDTIAVAHNLNDNIETLLINLIRGTGLTGLTGMRPSNNKIIRPLLFATRQAITDYSKQNHIIYREDRSNSDTKYTRNKIRHLVLPLLKEINPSIEATLNETAERFTGFNEIVSEYISGLRNTLSTEKNGLIIFNNNLLKAYAGNKTVLFELFKQYGISNVQLNDLAKIIEGKTGSWIVTTTHRIMKNRKEIIVSDEVSGVDTFHSIKNLTGLRNIPEIVSARYVEIAGKFKFPVDNSIACIDAAKISFPLIIRKWKAGDHFQPLGMKHNKKLSDYFIDNKYSRLDKENILILESDEKIVWIIGDRIDDRFRITKSTKKGLLIKSIRKILLNKQEK
jgi:tRNA(Ile)-lysidine synthase